jgi:hypothetical protein
MKKDGFLKSIPFSGMSIIEFLLIIFLFCRRYLNWILRIDINIFLSVGIFIFVSITLLLSCWPKVRYYSKMVMYGELGVISIYYFILLSITIIIFSFGKKLSIFEKKFSILLIIILISLTLIVSWLKRKSEPFIIERLGISWAILLFFLLGSLSISISLHQLLPINILYLSSFLFLIGIGALYCNFIRMKNRTLKENLYCLIDSQIFDAIISIVFYLIIMIFGSAILIFYFSNFTKWINILAPLIAVSVSLWITMKSYEKSIKEPDKGIIIFSWIFCIVLFISIFIMTVQKNIWGTYTGLKVILGALLGIDAIFLLALKQKDVFIDNLEKDPSLIKNPNSELTIKRIKLFLGNITILFTFVNVIFYNDAITKKIIKILSPFLETIAPKFLYAANEIDNHIKIITLSIIIILITFIFAILLLFVEEYICRKIFFRKKLMYKKHF